MVDPDSANSAGAHLNCGPGDLVADRYCLGNRLGSGGMGSVWGAHDVSLDAPCAIKLVVDDQAMNDELRMRFAREARASAQLRSPHVVQILDFGDWDGTLFIAMEYLDGEDLATRLDRVGTLNPASAYRIVAHVARALMSAHARGIVHRDLKPENVFLIQEYEEETAKILDFGIAHLTTCSLQGKATRTGSFLGTPYYVSPEQARGKDIDHRTDLWSLGVIAFQCLTGRRPFESAALGELMGLILYEPLPRPTALNPRLPRGIDGWWQRAAARDREQRFQSAKELADALGSALGIETVVNVPAVSPRRTISFPDLDEASGIFTPLTAKRPSHALSERIACPSESAILDGLVPVVGEQQREPDARESNARSSGLPWTDGWFRRRLTSRSVIVLWLAVGIPAAGAAISLIVILALRLLYPAEPYRSATTLRVDASGMQVTKADLQDVPTVPAAAPSALSVDMLPLESTTAEPNDKSLSVDAGSTKSTSTKPAPLRTIGPGRKVPGGGLGAEPRSVPDDVRDYGI